MSARDRLTRVLPALVAAIVWIGVAFGRTPSIVDLFKQIETGDQQQKRHALRILATFERGDLAPRIAPYIFDADRSVARQAVIALGQCNNPKAAEYLVKAMEDKELRVKAIEAISNCEGLPAIPQLRAALDDPNPKVRKAARKALDYLESYGDQYHIPGPNGEVLGRRSEIIPDIEALWGIPDPGKAAAQ